MKPKRPHPFPPKLSIALAEEIRLLHRRGAAVKALARKYNVSPASVSAVLKLASYRPEYVVAVHLRPQDRAILAELAEEDGIVEEQRVSEIIARGIEEILRAECGAATCHK